MGSDRGQNSDAPLLSRLLPLSSPTSLVPLLPRVLLLRISISGLASIEPQTSPMNPQLLSEFLQSEIVEVLSPLKSPHIASWRCDMTLGSLSMEGSFFLFETTASQVQEEKSHLHRLSTLWVHSFLFHPFPGFCLSVVLHHPLWTTAIGHTQASWGLRQSWILSAGMIFLLSFPLITQLASPPPFDFNHMWAHDMAGLVHRLLLGAETCSEVSACPSQANWPH